MFNGKSMGQYPSQSKERRREYNKQYRMKHGELINAKKRDDRKYYPEIRYKESVYQRKYNMTHKDAVNNRITLVKILGGICSSLDCLVPKGCTDIRCLQLDHRNGGGMKDVKRFTCSGNMYKYYLDHIDEAKEKLQILCANCNWIKKVEKGEHKGPSIILRDNIV